MNVLRRKKRNPVTIIIAIKSQGGVVIGSDGQTSYQASTAKDLDTNKIAAMQFSNGQALVAQAGDSDCATRALEAMHAKAVAIKIESGRTVADLAELVIAERKQHLRDYNEHLSSSEDLNRLFYENDFSLLTAAYFNGNPYVHIASLQHGMAIVQNKDYATAGCGGSVAQMFLCDLAIDKMNMDNITCATAYIIEKVKKYDLACGGDTHLAILNKDGSAMSGGENYKELMKRVTKACHEFDEEERTLWQNNMMKVVERVAKKMPPKASS